MSNRPIKFRTWLESENRFLDNKEIAETLIKFHLPDDKITSQPLIHVALLLGNEALGWTFQQFTGLTDSTGKEIYEGDIFKSGTYKWDAVEFQNGKFVVNLRGARFYDLCELFNDDGKPKIAGNVFETPELLA